jgi:hypothetical protein
MSTPKTASMAVSKNQNEVIGLILPLKMVFSQWIGYQAGLKSPRRAGYGFVMTGLTNREELKKNRPEERLRPKG